MAHKHFVDGGICDASTLSAHEPCIKWKFSASAPSNIVIEFLSPTVAYVVEDNTNGFIGHPVFYVVLRQSQLN